MKRYKRTASPYGLATILLFLFRVMLPIFPSGSYDFHAVFFLGVCLTYCTFPPFIPVRHYIAGSPTHAITFSTFLRPAALALACTESCNLHPGQDPDQSQAQAPVAIGEPFPGIRHGMPPGQMPKNSRSLKLRERIVLAGHQSKSRSFQLPTTLPPGLCLLRAATATTPAHGFCTPARSATPAAYCQTRKNQANRRTGNFPAFQNTFPADSTAFQNRNHV